MYQNCMYAATGELSCTETFTSPQFVRMKTGLCVDMTNMQPNSCSIDKSGNLGCKRSDGRPVAMSRFAQTPCGNPATHVWLSTNGNFNCDVTPSNKCG